MDAAASICTAPRPAQTASRLRVAAAAIGRFFGSFDLLIYGSFAVVTSRRFFPAADPASPPWWSAP